MTDNDVRARDAREALEYHLEAPYHFGDFSVCTRSPCVTFAPAWRLEILRQTARHHDHDHEWFTDGEHFMRCHLCDIADEGIARAKGISVTELVEQRDAHACPRCGHDKVNHQGKDGPCYVMDCVPCGNPDWDNIHHGVGGTS
jgi:uncharacterized C2H2 Zn-finger protein